MTRGQEWIGAQLGGATQGVGFPEVDILGACVQYLIFDGHGHHFAVLDDGTSLWCSEMAIRCLVEAGLLPEGLLPGAADVVEATGEPPAEGRTDEHDEGKDQDAVVAPEGAEAPGELPDTAEQDDVGRVGPA